MKKISINLLFNIKFMENHFIKELVQELIKLDLIKREENKILP